MTNEHKTPGASAPGEGKPDTRAQSARAASNTERDDSRPIDRLDGPLLFRPPPETEGGGVASDDGGSQCAVPIEPREFAPDPIRRTAMGLAENPDSLLGSSAPLPDPAIAIGLAIRLGRMARRHSSTLPPSVLRQLRRAAIDGSAAATVVETWGVRIGVIERAVGANNGSRSCRPSTEPGSDHE